MNVRWGETYVHWAMQEPLAAGCKLVLVVDVASVVLALVVVAVVLVDVVVDFVVVFVDVVVAAVVPVD